MAERLRPTLRDLLEGDFRALAAAGFAPAAGERELVFRVKPDGRLAWFETRRIRTPSTELEADDAGAA